jgi:hypothetical protein
MKRYALAVLAALLLALTVQTDAQTIRPRVIATPPQDVDRTSVVYYATAVASGTTGTETAITLTKASGTAATTTAASFNIPAGKTFRITSITFATRGNAVATAQVTTFSLRVNTAGAVTTASTPIVLQMRSATDATASAWDRVTMEPKDGYEIAGSATLEFGVTANAVFVTNAPTWDVTIVGQLY